MVSFSGVKAQLVEHGPWAAVVYHIIHYVLLFTLFGAWALAPLDLGEYVAVFMAAFGVEVDAETSRLGAAWVLASATGKLFIPAKIWLTIKSLPIAEPRLRRVWTRCFGRGGESGAVPQRVEGRS
jgi:hypothetical protein